MCGPLMQESAISQTSGVNLPVQNRKTRYIREVSISQHFFEPFTKMNHQYRN